MSLTTKASEAQTIAHNTQGHHTNKTYNPGHIEPWLRETILAFQRTVNALAETQLEIARQVDRNTARLARIEQYLSSQQAK